MTRCLLVSFVAVPFLAAACLTSPAKQSDDEQILASVCSEQRYVEVENTLGFRVEVFISTRGGQVPLGMANPGRTRLLLDQQRGYFYALDENGRRTNIRGGRRVTFRVTCG